MPPNLILIRHAEGYHNLSIAGHSIRDPTLTPHGESQCATLATTLSDLPKIDFIVASPLRRALYTALRVFAANLEANPFLRIIALPELQETSDLPCDTGSTLAELKVEFADLPVDLSWVEEGWMVKSRGTFSPHSERIMQRCREARAFLRNINKNNIAVVTHGAVLHYLTGDWAGATIGVGTGWVNCEARRYIFDETTEAKIARAEITELAIARKERTGDASPAPPARQARMRKDAEKLWSKDGYIVMGDGETGCCDVM